jgi:hypothetical protein
VAALVGVVSTMLIKMRSMTKSIKVMGELTIIWLKAQVLKVEQRGILKIARLRCLFWSDFDDFSGLVTCFGFGALVLSLPGTIS